MSISSVHAAFEQAYGRCKRAAQTKDNEQTQRLLPECFDTDTERRSERDVSQIGKYLQREYQMTLSEEVVKHHSNKTFLVNANKVLHAEFVAIDKCIRTHLPELERNKLRSNFELADHFTDGSRLDPLASSPRRSSRSGRSPGSTPLSCAQTRPARGRVPPPRVLANLLGPQRPLRHGAALPEVHQTRQGEKAKDIKQPTMTAPAAFTVDAPLFVEPKSGGLRKRLNRNLFGFYMPQLVDDDMHFSTRLFNATLLW